MKALRPDDLLPLTPDRIQELEYTVDEINRLLEEGGYTSLFGAVKVCIRTPNGLCGWMSPHIYRIYVKEGGWGKIVGCDPIMYFYTKKAVTLEYVVYKIIPTCLLVASVGGYLYYSSL